MPLIANVTTNSTFNQWLTQTNLAITELNQNVLKFDTTSDANAAVNGTLSAATIRANVSVNTLLLSVTGNASFTGANLIVQGTNTAISSNVVLSGANVGITGVLRVGGAASVNGIFEVAANASFNSHISTLGTATIGSALQVGGPLYYGDLTVITATTLIANVDNWTPPGHGDAIIIRAQSTGIVTVNGLTSVDPSRGRFMFIENIGGFSIFLGHEILSSTANNRFLTPLSTAFEVRAGTGVHLWYDKLSLRWRVMDTVTPLPSTASFATLSATTFSAVTAGITTLTATNGTVTGSLNVVHLGTSGSATLNGQVAMPSALGVQFGGASQDAFLFSPSSVWMNVDSDNNNGAATFTVGRGRTASSGGSTLLSVNSAQLFVNTASMLVNGTVSATTFVGAHAWSSLTGRPGIVFSTGGDLLSNQNLRTTDVVTFGSISTPGIVIGGFSANSSLWVAPHVLANFLSITGTSALTGNVTASGSMTISQNLDVGTTIAATTGLFFGSVTVLGNINVSGTKNFAIPHPLKSLRSAGVQLRHTAVESPYTDLVYRGVATLSGGMVRVNIDQHSRMHEGTFEALTRRAQGFAQAIDAWVAVRARVEGNQVVIECQDVTSDAQVVWMVWAERADETLHSLPTTDADGRFVTESLADTYNELSLAPRHGRSADPWCQVELPDEEPASMFDVTPLVDVTPKRRAKKKTR